MLKVDTELFKRNSTMMLKEKRQQTQDAVSVLDFETAAIIRDEIAYLEGEAGGKVKKKKKGLI